MTGPGTTPDRRSLFPALRSRVRITERCSWTERRGKLGIVTAVNPGGKTVHVRLDDEEEYFPDGGTASFCLDSVELVWPV